MATTCLNTTVRNMSGRSRYFGFLGRRGKTLAAGQSFQVFGDLGHLLGLGTHGGSDDSRRWKSFQAAVDSGFLALVETPAPHLYDQTLDMTKVVKIDNGTVSAADPCWGAYSSSIAGVDQLAVGD